MKTETQMEWRAYDRGWYIRCEDINRPTLTLRINAETNRYMLEVFDGEETTWPFCGMRDKDIINREVIVRERAIACAEKWWRSRAAKPYRAMAKEASRKVNGVHCDLRGWLANVGDIRKVHFSYRTWEGDGEIEKAQSEKGRIGYIVRGRFLDKARVLYSQASALDYLTGNFRESVADANRGLTLAAACG